MKISGIYRIVWSVIAAGLLYYIAAVIKPFLFLDVQQTPFLHTGEYFAGFLSRPGGIIQYLAHFLMQGFHGKLLASLILLSLLLLQAVLLSHLLKTLFKQMCLLWPYLLLFTSLLLVQNYYFPLIVLIQQVFVLLALILAVRISVSGKRGWILHLVLYLILYYVLGPGPSLVFAAGCIVIQLISLSPKAYYKSGILFIAAAIFPYILYLSILNTPIADAYLRFFPDLSILIRYRPGTWFYVYVFMIPLILVVAGLHARIIRRLTDTSQRIVGSVYMAWTLVILIGVASVFLLRSSFDQKAQNIALCEYYNSHGDYQKTIDLALSAPDEYDIFINLAYNRAIAQNGEFTKRLLEYPQLLGSRILQPDILGNPLYMTAASDLYYDLGYISQSQHHAYSILAIEPDNLWAKKRLVQTNILLSNPRAAKVYLESISESYHTKDFVNRYSAFIEDSSLVVRDTELASKASLMPESFGIPAMIKDRLHYLIQKNGSNMLAHEYLQACNLLDHQLGDFMKDLDASLEFYNYIPEIYGQAIIMYFFSESKEGLGTFQIDQSAKDQFNEFLRVMSSFGNNPKLARGELHKLSDTYMYYVTYLSPRVTKVEVVNEIY